MDIAVDKSTAIGTAEMGALIMSAIHL